MEDDLKQFLAKAAQVGPIIDEKCDYKYVEPILRELVQIIRRNPNKTDWFESAFITMAEEPKIYSELVITYCMHVLQFPRVLAYAKKRLENDVYRTDDRARRICDAYSPNWLTGRIFDFYGV